MVLLPISRDVPLVLQCQVHGAVIGVQWSSSKVKVHHSPGVHGDPVPHAVPGGNGITQLRGRGLLTEVVVQPGG